MKIILKEGLPLDARDRVNKKPLGKVLELDLRNQRAKTDSNPEAWEGLETLELYVKEGQYTREKNNIP